MDDTEHKMPRELLRQLRGLAHDLSNALETIVQANYLVAQSAMPEESRRWLGMIAKASEEAVRINRELKEILRSQ